ncbi:MAG: TonB-dependent receptor [Bacteroidota bacterium]|nr:TonB-dependent receptor [Bacteroidota bacterium]
MKKIIASGFLSLITVFFLVAQNQTIGSLKGVVVDKSTENPLEFVNVVIKNKKTDAYVLGAVTDKNGVFLFQGLPYGTYKISYSFIGFDKTEVSDIILDSKHSKVNIGKLYLTETSKALGEVEIIGQKSTFVNSIDRKTFNVGQDLMSKTGSVSDLLQNVPSVQVDIDGNVALRGSDNVTILIDGKPSALMGANRAAVLQQMPANSIEKIEVITNPSAKYKPDGTSGIINIVLKKDKGLGLNGAVSANVGNNRRYNGNVVVNYNPGKLNVFGSYSIRQDDRLRFTDDYRKRSKLNGDSVNYFLLNSQDYARPLSQIIRAGFDYRLNSHNKVGVSGSYNYRIQTRHSTDVDTYRNADLSISKHYDRLRYDPEYEKDKELTAYWQHTFAKEGHELNLDYTTSQSREQEDNHYSNIYHVPAQSSTFDNTLIKQGGDQSQLSLAYTNPLTENSKFESGYIYETNKADMDFYGESLNQQQNLWQKDVTKSNHFVYTEKIHVLYATYEHSLGKFGFLAGVRAEQAYIKSNQITTDTIINNDYFRLYPTLHLSYNLTDEHQLQLNYSHRIRRPEGDDMNPFPEYQDPYNLRIGNPHLKPADIHSIELGYQFKKNRTTFLSTLYYRYTYNSMSEITRYMNDTVKLTTKENLSRNRSAGLELIVSTSIGNFANINLSTNTFYNTIDASNLGYSQNKSIIAWSANLSSGFNLTKSTVLQLTSNYTAERLTPQGRQLPSFVMNAGFKQEIFQKKGALILTVSDVFNSLRNNTVIDMPGMYEKISRKRSARMIYAGFTYSFGNPKKKSKDMPMKFDDQL